MSETENKALVRRLLDELRDGWHPATIEKYFAPGYRRHLTATSTPLTREEQRQRATRLRVAFPDAQATLEDIFAEGDRVAYRLTIRGTQAGEFLGVPAPADSSLSPSSPSSVSSTASSSKSGAASTSPTSYGRCAAPRPRPDGVETSVGAGDGSRGLGSLHRRPVEG